MNTEMIFQTIRDTTKTISDTSIIAGSKLQFDPTAILNMDCNGNGNSIIITVIGMGVVFVSLFLLFVLFLLTTKIINWTAKRRYQFSTSAQTGIPAKKDMSIPAETTAAIGMALHLYYSEIHDIENTVITIKKVSKNYSPWNSKIYGLRRNPRAI
jgi:glutaconyl-CoA/methylmalonyl-CoA decarboxylase subunit delta